MNNRALVALASAGSAAALAGALVSQYVFGLAPCALCIWQRWPHLAAVMIGALWLAALPRHWLAALGALAALATAGVGGFHMGVEYLWWAGLESCSGGEGIRGLSVEALLDPTADVAAPVRCDEVAFSFLGLSMAGWNMVASLGFAGLWARVAMR
jgi:disulfide bond formation protein DsbB